MSTKWDRRFLELARVVAGWSPDPSTRCGACVVDPKNRIISLGFNGFARGVADDPGRYADRDTKYAMTVHAEVNAILFAGRDLTGCTLYTVPFQACSRCASVVIQSGISRVVAPPCPDDKVGRWAADFALAAAQFREAGVSLEFAAG